ncbi:hypothetical protein [Pseudoalteromonas luteoviolacea]|uniref:Uncharacterized protein n=1 Tax=Pseudoalteromonas luteoviolacea (strain 2ta16) TaxID=1353533 RepID=V4H9J2_PSEL2|nr:hypothetical protein [Pseudoalteromonas luteoviolacea]ESP94151.1 hypothetical protein PL2TA16_02401 [Pseudoalteromonas luteoviolacea 2ta16]KZN38796.1 hypothetical protein N483_00065 [Pseudoalteromonas luteoviolacea NCIMB 1944]
MKKLVIASVFAGLSGVAAANTVELESAENSNVAFEKAEVTIAASQGVFASGVVTYYSPRVWVNGRLQQFFVGPTNGNQFCEERGHNQEVSGSTITCGEDESSYANYDWYGKSWTYKSTGSKNQCYQLYATIKCQ